MELFPMFLKIQGRPCLVVGAGRVAESKIASLVRCGANVRVVAPEATEAVRDAAKAGKIVWEQRTFQPSDLAGVFLAVAATSSPELHEQIFRQAQQDGILCNTVDEPERCEFYYPAVVRRGPLQIAISTSGCAPSLAQRLRQELEQLFGAEYGPWVEELGRSRSELLARSASPEDCRGLIQELSSELAFQEFSQRGKVALAEKGEA
jgi:precorrin-2 dehydrogenase / sirohydrochlorin ferrochelatase